MNKRLLDYSDIINGENTCAITTNTILKGIYDNWPRFINNLLQLMYFTGENKNVETPKGLFHSFAWHKYLEAPYSFRALFILYEKGYYLNAAILYRSLLESFILCRYLYNNKEQTDDVWIGRKVDVDGKKRFIRIKDMFNEISPGYYDKYYGQQLSGMAHGKIAAHLFRIKRSSPTNGIIISVPEYNEDDATFIVNYTNALMYGYFNYFPKFFSDGFTTILQNVMSEYDYAKVWLESSMGKHKQANPESEKWYTHMDKIIL